MKTRKVNRYYCDHCRKAGQSARWMKHHEESCTSNPNRICRLCGDAKNAQAVLAAIPESIRFSEEDLPEIDELGVNQSAMDDFMKLVRSQCGGCPVCVWAACKATGLPGALFNINLKEEIAAWWQEKNDAMKEDQWNENELLCRTTVHEL